MCPYENPSPHPALTEVRDALRQATLTQSSKLTFERFPVAKLGPKDKPVVIVDGVLHRLKQLTKTLTGDAAQVIGIRDADLPTLVARLQVERLFFYEMRAADIGPLEGMERLRHLKIEWNTKLVSLDPLRRIRNLQTLVLEHTPKVFDLAPLQDLTELTAFQFSGGVWACNRIHSLEPLARLSKLEELVLTNLAVETGGLRPLAHCKTLKTLSLSNQFETSDYAYLSVALPRVADALSAPWFRIKGAINGQDTMIIGRKKPILDSRKDAAKITAYEEAFRRLQDSFRQ